MKSLDQDANYASRLCCLGYPACPNPGPSTTSGKTDIWWRQSLRGTTPVLDHERYDLQQLVTMAYTETRTWKMVGIGDFNNDGDLDICGETRHGRKRRLVHVTRQSFKWRSIIQPDGPIPFGTVVGTAYYFDSPMTTAIDILWRNKVTADNAIWFMDGTTLRSSVLISRALI